MTSNSNLSSSKDDTLALFLQDIRLTLVGAAGAVNILRGIDFAAHRGETIGVVGPSGAGKSSLLMVLAGLEKPTGGRLNIVGEDVLQMSEDELAEFRRDHVGIVFQDFHLVPTMTARENVAVPLELAGRKDALEVADKLLGEVGLSERVFHYPSELSGGEQQRVALARALAPEPSLILADEPTGNLDGATGEMVMDLLFKLKKNHHSTLVLITHDMEVARRCSRIVKIEDGKIVTDAVNPQKEVN